MFGACTCKEDGIGIPYFDFVIYAPGSQDSGSASANVFDKKWQATAYLFPFDLDTQYTSIRFETFSPDGFLRDAVFFGNFALKEGFYTVTNGPIASTSQGDHIIKGGYGQFEDDGDVIYGGYELDDVYTNRFHIDHIDTISHTIEGRFSALFTLREAYFHNDLARQVLFEDGAFIVKY